MRTSCARRALRIAAVRCAAEASRGRRGGEFVTSIRRRRGPWQLRGSGHRGRHRLRGRHVPHVQLEQHLPRRVLPIRSTAARCRSALRWAKQVPMIVSSELLGMALDGQGRVVLSGNYSGSMQVDDRLLVTAVPEQPSDHRLVPRLVRRAVAARHDASQRSGPAADPTGTPIFTVPSNIFAQATSAPAPWCSSCRQPRSTTEMLPTGVPEAGRPAPASRARRPPTRRSRSARPPSRAPRPIRSGTTRARRSRSRSSTARPGDLAVPAPITAEATGPGGATVTYPTPTATDQVDCSSSATPDAGPPCTPTSNACITPVCTPASGEHVPDRKHRGDLHGDRRP